MNKKIKLLLASITIASLIAAPMTEVTASIVNEAEILNSVEFLLNKTYQSNSFYYYNMAYAEILKLSPEKQDVYMNLLAKKQNTVYTPGIQKFTKMFGRLAAVGGGGLYNEIEAELVNSNLREMDKAYLLGELTGWGRRLVFTQDYITAVDELNKAWTDKNVTTLQVERLIKQVTNQKSREYLEKELDNLRLLRKESVSQKYSRPTFDDILLTGYKSYYRKDSVAAIEAADKIIKEIIKPGMTDYEKEWALYKYLIDHTLYDYETFRGTKVNRLSYTSEGALVYGLAVCQGYSEALRLLLNKVGIESIIVSSAVMDHAWNIVELDGKSYHVDATWGDREDKEKLYFNLTENAMAADHVWDTPQYPVCDSIKYNPVYESYIKDNGIPFKDEQSTISGTVSLPNGEISQKDVVVTVYAEKSIYHEDRNDAKIYDYSKFAVHVVLPKGANSVQYNLSLPKYREDFRVSYIALDIGDIYYQSATYADTGMQRHSSGTPVYVHNGDKVINLTVLPNEANRAKAKELIGTELKFQDPELEKEVRLRSGKKTGELYPKDVEKIWNINLVSVSSLEGIQSLPNLTQVQIKESQLSDISPLKSLTKLTYLDLYSCQISDLTPLKELTNLEHLTLRFNNISDISPLSGLTKLKELGLGTNKITDLSPLKALTNLESLDFGFNPLEDVNVLNNLTNLTNLSFNSTRVGDLTSLQNLTKLTYLSIAIGQVTDVSPLSNLTNLTSLNLDSNMISDISPLKNLKKLNSLNLANTIVTPEDYELLKQALPSCNITAPFNE